ncbi:MAG: hypothetical protein AAGD01_18600 [Acidobacteriota bacterium]
MNPTSPLIQRVLAGADRNLQMLAADGLLPVPPEELIPVQIFLARSPDVEVSTKAKLSLTGTAPRLVSSYLKEVEEIAPLEFFLRTSSEPLILQTILQRRNLPNHLLLEVAPKLDGDLQEILLLRQDQIIQAPQILDALEQNPQLSAYSKRRIQEYREHLLPREKPEKPKTKAIEEVTEEEVQEAIAEVKRTIPAEGEEDDLTGLTEVQIKALPIPVRMKLTVGANRTLRGILIRDVNSTVAMTCLENNSWADTEIESVCQNRNTHEEVMLGVSRNRQWMSKYAIVQAFVRNPRAPVGLAIKLLSRLSVRDLRDLRRDRNVPDPVRQTANRLYRIKVR